MYDYSILSVIEYILHINCIFLLSIFLNKWPHKNVHPQKVLRLSWVFPNDGSFSDSIVLFMVLSYTPKKSMCHSCLSTIINVNNFEFSRNTKFTFDFYIFMVKCFICLNYICYTCAQLLSYKVIPPLSKDTWLAKTFKTTLQ